MKLLEVVTMVDIKVCQQAWFISYEGSGVSVNEQLAEEFHKLVVKKLKIRKV